MICMASNLSVLRSVLFPSPKNELFLGTLVGLGYRVNGRLCPNSMTRKVVKERLILYRIMKEVVSSLK